MINNFRLGLTSVLIIISLLFLNGCILVPFINAAKDSGVTESDRMRLFAQDVQHFTEAVGWGHPADILMYATDDFRQTLANQLGESEGEQKIVDSKVKNVQFTESAFKADVQVAVRFYQVPYYVVRTRVEQQLWDFSMGSGWKISGRTIKSVS